MFMPASIETNRSSTASHPRTHGHSNPGVEIAPVTGPLAVLAGKKVLLLADIENWIYSARSLGARVSFSLLGEKLRVASRSCGLHAFFSSMPGDESRREYLEMRGWTPHQNDIEEVATCRGTERRANCDNFLLFGSGVLVSRSDAEAVVIGSGDGQLSGELARALRKLPKPRQIFTLSLAGSTAASLNAEENPNIDANIELGMDCLRMAGPRLVSEHFKTTYPATRWPHQERRPGWARRNPSNGARL